MGGAVEHDLLVREVEGQVVFTDPVDVSHALDEVHLGDTLAGIAEAEGAELHGGVRSQAHRTAVFKLDLGLSGVTGAQLRSLSDGQVDKSVLEAQACVLVDLNRA